MSRSVFVTLALLSVLALAACGTLEIGIERTTAPMPTYTATVTVTGTALPATPTKEEPATPPAPTATRTVPPPPTMTPPPTPTATATPATAGWATYSAPRFGVSLSHPPDWQAAPGEESRYEGSDGFFALDAIGSPAATIDDIAAGQAGHRLLPYGSQPVIEALEVDGQEARLILPSADATMRGQAMLIVRYPQPIQLGDQVQFFALYADQDHIGAIAQTVRFL